MKNIIIITLALLIIFSASPILSRDSTPGHQQFAEFLDQTIPGRLKLYGITGAAVALVEDGQPVWSKGYGMADRQSAQPMTPDTLMQAASISKSVTAWGVIKLVEQNRISLDDPIEEHLSRWHLPQSKFDHQQVTVGRVLSHTGGLSLHGYLGIHPDAGLLSLEDSLSGKGRFGRGLRVIREPGSGWRYSGGGYTLAQLMVEEVTQDNFADYMKREVLLPLGMADSSFDCEARNQAAAATPYGFLGAAKPSYCFTALAAAGLYTSANDLAKFAAAILPGPGGEPAGRGVLSAQSIELMTTPTPESQGVCGLGYFTRTLPDGTLMVLHGGDNRGWKALFAVMPEQDRAIVIMTNSDRASFFFRDRLLKDWIDHSKIK